MDRHAANRAARDDGVRTLAAEYFFSSPEPFPQGLSSSKALAMVQQALEFGHVFRSGNLQNVS